VIVPLTRLGDSTPEIDPCGEAATSFGAAFTVLRRAIERDFVMLTGVGYHVLRPCALFVSDGQPTDPATWPDDYAAVVDRNWPARPDMLAFGVGDADLATIARIGTVSPNPAGLAGLYEFVRERAISTFTTSRLENARPATDRLEKGATGLDLERSWIRVRE
jgi:uncharacterized protein YegL